MPAEHLARVAAAGASPAQQLEALAGLHARTARGRPTSMRQTRVQLADLQQPWATDLSPRNSSLSPAGDLAVVSWTSETAGGAVVLELPSERIAGRRPLRHAVPSKVLAADFSPCGRRCTAISASLAGGAASVTASSFDVQRRSWMPRVPVAGDERDAWLAERQGRVDFSSAGAPQLAASFAIMQTLLVMSEAQATCIPAQAFTRCAWVPGEHAIMLVGERTIARLDALALLAEPTTRCLEAPLAHFPLPDGELGGVDLVAAPEGKAVWEVHMLSGPGVRLTAYSTADLDCQGSYAYQPAFPEKYGSTPLSVAASRRAVAVCFGGCTLVYARKGAFALAGQLFCAAEFHYADFSGDGRWLAGAKSGLGHGTIMVLDVRTGSTVVSLETAGGYLNPRSFMVAVGSPRWSSCFPSQLHVKSGMTVVGNLNNVLFTVVDF